MEELNPNSIERIPRTISKYQTSSSGEHRHGIGKYFLKKKKIYAEDLTAKKLIPTQSMQTYYDRCLQQGLQIQKLELAEFSTKNGLKYSGFRATEAIHPSDILIKVPKELILNTKICFFSDIQIVIKENLKFFSAVKDGSLIEDHIMLVYLLRQHALKDASPWFYLLSNLSKDIDTIDFWNTEVYAMLEDDNFVKRIHIQRKYFAYVYKNLKSILSRYTDLFPEDIVTESNIQWLYIHIQSRCFGGQMDYVSMVPIVEMMNHENTNLYFRLHTANTPIEKVEITDKEIDQHTSSDYDSNLSDEQTLNETDEITAVDAGTPTSIDFLQSIRKNYTTEQFLETERIVNFIQNQFENADGVSYSFSNHIMRKLSKILSEMTTSDTRLPQALQSLLHLCEFFTSLLKSYSRKQQPKKPTETEEKDIKGTTSIEAQLERLTLNEQSNQNTQLNEGVRDSAEQMIEESCLNDLKLRYCDQPHEWKDVAYDSFVMMADETDRFEKGSQVYFCYNRLTNEQMLSRYGMALEYNKYDCVDFKCAYATRTGEQLPTYLFSRNWSTSHQQQKQPKSKNFAIWSQRFNQRIIWFYKAQLWNLERQSAEAIFNPTISLTLELAALNLVAARYSEYLESRKHSLSENSDKLYDPSLSFHEYFAVVYRLSKQRIIQNQLKLVQICIASITNMVDDNIKGVSYFEKLTQFDYEESQTTLSSDTYQRNRYVLRKYINYFPKHDQEF